MKTNTHLLTFALSLLSLSGFGADLNDVKHPDPLIGHWRWEGQKKVVEIKADGTIQSPYGTAVWRFIPSKAEKRHYEISWNSSHTVDEITLQPDGRKLHGKNSGGRKFNSEKVD